MCSSGLNIKGDMIRKDTWETLTPLGQQWTFILLLHSKGYEFIAIVGLYTGQPTGANLYHGKVYWYLFGAKEINDIIINVLTHLNDHFFNALQESVEEKKYIGGWIARCCRELTRMDH
jgi:hypothetical protein